MKRKQGFMKKTAAKAVLGLTGLAALVFGGCAKSNDSPAPNTETPPGVTVSDSTRLELNESLFEHYGTLTKNKFPHLLQDSVMTEQDIDDPQTKPSRSFGSWGDSQDGWSGFDAWSGSSDFRELQTYQPPLVQVTQRLDFGSLTPVFAKDIYDTGNLTVLLHAAPDSVLYTMNWNFQDGFTSSVSADGNLVDLLQEQLNIGGKNYTVTKAKTQWMGGEIDEVQLELMTGKVTATLNVGDSMILGVDGVDYEVTLINTTNTANGYSAKWQVNGEITQDLKAGALDALVNGQFIGTADAGNGIATFSMGAQKISIKDTNVNDNDYSGTVSGNGVFGQFLENTDARARIRASLSDDGTQMTLNEIAYRLLANTQSSKDVFVTPSETLSENIDFPGANLVEVGFDGLRTKKDDGTGNLVNRVYSSIEFNYATTANGSSYGMTFTSKEGNTYNNVNFIENVGTSATDRVLENKLIMTEGTSSAEKLISAGTQFVLSGPSDFTHVIKYDSIDTDNRKLTFTDLATGAREATYDENTGEASLVVGGDSYKVFVDVNTGNLAVDQNGDGVIDGSSVPIVDMYGARITVPTATQNVITANVSTSADKIDGSSVDEVVDLEFDISGTGIILDTPAVPVMYNGSGVQKGQSRYGVLCTKQELTGKMDLKYPEIQEEPVATLSER